MSPARLLFSTGSLYLMDTSFCFQLAAEIGFDGMEVMCDERYSTRDPHYLQKLSQHYNLPILVCHTPFSARVPGWGNANDEVGRIYHTLDLASELEAESIVVHVPRSMGMMTVQLNNRAFRMPWRTPYKAVRDWIKYDLPRVQAATPVKIGLENMPVKYLWGRQIDPTWWNEVESWGRVHTWLTLDTTHWATKGIDPLDAYRAAGGRVCHVHLSNFDGQEHRLPHKGFLDLGQFLRALAADSFAGTITLELDPHPLGFADEEILRRNLQESYDFCREHL
ncbi:MAG: sugar phosphate isomerase/epimerase [Anaerolineae bacterium]|nr:sugar phosphate isomerase/epimerase [Anaerolineae bacterium]